MGGGIEVRDSVITGDVSINTNPIRVECPSCKKSGLLTLYNCENIISVKCFDRICDECHKQDSICTMCREKERDLEVQSRRKILEKKLEKKEDWIKKFDEKFWKHEGISKISKLGLALFIISLILGIFTQEFLIGPYITREQANEVFKPPLAIISLMLMPLFYGGIAYLWLLVGKLVLEQQITELEEE